MVSSPSRALDPLQVRLLDAFKGMDGVWLTGGAALGGFHLGHRRSLDLDWFTAERERLEELARRLRVWCEDQGLECEAVQDYPGFRRYRVADGAHSTLVDLVHEPTFQVVPCSSKPVIAGVRVDPPRELVANKLAALLGRGETKDLVDLFFLARAGLDPLDAMDDALRKDAGMEAATLAWVLGQVPVAIGELLLEEALTQDELLAFRDGLVERLRSLSFPGAR